jgi:hypothetical protein
MRKYGITVLVDRDRTFIVEGHESFSALSSAEREKLIKEIVRLRKKEEFTSKKFIYQGKEILLDVGYALTEITITEK